MDWNGAPMTDEVFLFLAEDIWGENNRLHIMNEQCFVSLWVQAPYTHIAGIQDSVNLFLSHENIPWKRRSEHLYYRRGHNGKWQLKIFKKTGLAGDSFPWLVITENAGITMTTRRTRAALCKFPVQRSKQVDSAVWFHGYLHTYGSLICVFPCPSESLSAALPRDWNSFAPTEIRGSLG